MEDNLAKSVEKLEENVNVLEEKINKINTHFSRIEEKVNYIIDILESFLAADDDEEIEEDYPSNEGWISGLDSWKEDYEEED